MSRKRQREKRSRGSIWATRAKASWLFYNGVKRSLRDSVIFALVCENLG